MSAFQQPGGLNPVKDKTKQEYAPLAREKLKHVKGHEEELMGRGGMALLASMRIARLKDAGRRTAKP